MNCCLRGLVVLPVPGWVVLLEGWDVTTVGLHVLGHVPDSPVAPGGPMGPASPFSPGAPIGPVCPAAPGLPLSPETPFSPGAPFWPAIPVSPGSPLGPGVPSLPGRPRDSFISSEIQCKVFSKQRRHWLLNYKFWTDLLGSKMGRISYNYHDKCKKVNFILS